MFGQGASGGHISGVCDEGCETVMDPEDTWSELCGMCLHHRSGTQLTLYCPRTDALLDSSSITALVLGCPAVTRDTVSHYFLPLFRKMLEEVKA